MLRKAINFTTKELVKNLTYNFKILNNGVIDLENGNYACSLTGKDDITIQKELELYDKILHDKDIRAKMLGIKNENVPKMNDKIIEQFYELEVVIPNKFEFPTLFFTTEPNNLSKGYGMIVTRLGLIDKENCGIESQMKEIIGKDLKYLQTRNDILQYEEPELAARKQIDYTNNGDLNQIGWYMVNKIFNNKNSKVKDIVAKVLDPNNIGAIKTATKNFGMEEIPSSKKIKYFAISRYRFEYIDKIIKNFECRKSPGLSQ